MYRMVWATPVRPRRSSTGAPVFGAGGWTRTGAAGVSRARTPGAELDRRTRRRVGELDADRLGRDLPQHGGGFLAQLREGLAAGRVPLALGDQAVERRLGGTGQLQRVALAGRPLHPQGGR